MHKLFKWKKLFYTILRFLSSYKYILLFTPCKNFIVWTYLSISVLLNNVNKNFGAQIIATFKRISKISKSVSVSVIKTYLTKNE